MGPSDERDHPPYAEQAMNTEQMRMPWEVSYPDAAAILTEKIQYYEAKVDHLRVLRNMLPTKMSPEQNEAIYSLLYSRDP
jgi:hypothetical protein